LLFLPVCRAAAATPCAPAAVRLCPPTSPRSAQALVDADSVERIASITDNIGVVYAGMGPDFRLLVRKGQKKAQAYRLTYGVRARVAPRRAAPRVASPRCALASAPARLPCVPSYARKRRSRSRCWS